MPAQWIIFIPRSREVAAQPDLSEGRANPGPTLIQAAESWKTRVEMKRTSSEDTKYLFSVKCAGEAFPGPSQTKDDVVYIMGGHGTPSHLTVAWPAYGENPLDADTIAGPFAKGGWPTDFAGRVKIYSCYSAQSGFGKAVAQLLSGKRNYTKCSYFGYKHRITMEYQTLDLAQEPFKTLYAGKEKYGGETHRWAAILGDKSITIPDGPRARDNRDPF